jgi:hypothetical protein
MNFIFKLSYINNMRRFHCYNSIHIPPLYFHSSSFPSSPFFQIVVGFIMRDIYYIWHTLIHFTPQYPLLFLSPLPRDLDTGPTNLWEHALFWAWLISLSMMISSYIHFSANDIISFFFIHSSVVEHLSYFHIWTIVKRAVINMDMQVSLLYVNLHPFRYMTM